MKSILITGCRSGIGLELVKQLLQHETAKPDVLIATCRRKNEAPELNEIESKNKNVHVLELELTEFDAYPDFTKKVTSLVGDEGLNVVFHNAGILLNKGSRIETVKADDLIEQFKVNSVAPVMLTQALLPLLEKASKKNSEKEIGVCRAAVICTSSVLGSISLNNSGENWGYRESKAAVNMSFQSLTAELKGRGIATLVLHPGWVRTKMGGPDAPVSPQDSAKGLLDTILHLSPATNGAFLKFDGSKLPW